MNHFNHHWLAGGSAGCAGHGITGITDDAIYPVGGLVLCPFFPALSRLVTVPLMVWQLSTFLAETSCDAVRRQTTDNFAYFAHVCYFSVVCPDVMGARYVIDNSRSFAFLYVASSGD